jgi:hypothetical protein
MSGAAKANEAMPNERGPKLYGLIAEFDSPGDLLEAASRTKAEGYRDVDTFSPFPIHGMDKALGLRRTKLPLIVLVGGLTGLGTALLMQWCSAAVHFASFAAVLGMIGLNGLPMPYHPVFNAPRFALASRDRFFLCIEARDPKFDRESCRRFLETLGAHDIAEVEE